MENNDAQIEQEIQAKGKTAPRITPADIEANISSESYFTAADGMRFQWLTSDHSDREQRDAVRRIADSIPSRAYGGACIDIDSNSNGVVRPEIGLLTFCVIVLRNGFTVTGESACASPENFDAEIGRKIARDNAINKVWPLMGYALKNELHRRAQFDAEPKVGTNVSVSHAPRKLDAMARIAHEVNRAYCAALGDTSQPAWEDAPEWQRSSARMGVDLHTMGDFGPEASHISWMSQKLAEGWVYGPVKDAEAKTHPCIMPFSDLPREQQAKDFIFRAVVHALK